MIYADIILEYSFAGHIVSLHVEHHMSKVKKLME